MTAGTSGAGQTADPAPLLACRNLWKIFGVESAAARALLTRHDTAEAVEVLRARGLAPAVADVSLDIRRGEILMIMGLSGSGKSTVLRCLSRLIEPTAGTIHLAGQDLLAAKSAELIRIRRSQMGMVFQNFGLLDHLNVEDNIAFPLRVQGIRRTDRLKRAAELIALVGLAGKAQRFPHELSGGQRQRVGIARSLMTDPALWLLDEPFSALDPLIRRQMQEEFLRLQSQLNKTIVFVTHDFLEAARLGDRIVIMRDGQVVQIGSVPEIVLSPADGYVRDFVADLPVTRVLKAADIAIAARPGAPATGPDVPATASLDQVIQYFLAGAKAVRVTYADTRPAGIIELAAIERILRGDRSGG